MAKDATKPPGQDPNHERKDSDARKSGRPTGRVEFDDRGNAIWNWSLQSGAFSRDLSTDEINRLEHPALSIADEPGAGSSPVKANPLGAVRGYDPYDSGQIDPERKKLPQKKDLRKLSDWIKLQKQVGRKDDDKR